MQNVRFYGQEPYELAVVHGGPGALGSVAEIARVLAKDFGVIEPLQTKLSIKALLQELNEVLVSSSRKPITLLGHSWGAWLVFMYAAKYPKQVKKIILVGSGPFVEAYVPKISKNRLARLTASEQQEFKQIIKQLSLPDTLDREALLPRLGQLADQADSYKLIKLEHPNEELPFNQAMYQNIWPEAAAMRKQGQLITLAKEISCPVVAIHGEYDPHPVQGVTQPLENRLENYKLYKLEKCGHSPWKEHYAYHTFYDLVKKEVGESDSLHG